MKTITLCFALLAGVSATAQETSITTSDNHETSNWLSWDRLGVFLGAYPLPIFSGGFGVAAEYRLTDHWSLWGDADRAVTQRGGADELMYGIEAGTKVTNTTKMIGLRGYLHGTDESGFFIGAGFKSVDIDTEATPGIVAGPNAHEHELAQGAYGALGYRVRGRDTGRVQWLLDVGLHYGPGHVKSARYVADSYSILGAKTAHLETETDAGFFPEARIGCRF